MRDSYNGQLLNRKQASSYLTNVRGLQVAAQTLAKLATNGGGPIFRKFGRRAVYRQADLDGWADQKLGAPQRSTSDTQEAA